MSAPAEERTHRGSRGGYGCVALLDTCDTAVTEAASVTVTWKYDVVAVVRPVMLNVTTPLFTAAVCVTVVGDVMLAFADRFTVYVNGAVPPMGTGNTSVPVAAAVGVATGGAIPNVNP